MNEHTTEPAVRTVMTAAPHTVGPDADFKTIAGLLAGKRISAVPVVDTEGGVLGVVSEADLLHHGDGGTRHRLLTGRGHRDRQRKATALRARELMTTPAITIGADEPVSAASQELRRHNLRRLLVVDDRNRLVGVVARRDLIGAFSRSDDDIRRAVAVDVFARVLLVEPDAVGIAVERGVVTLVGQLPRKSDTELAGRITRSLAGVIEVRNRLGYVWNDHPDGRRVGSRS
ncbi:CBS domain-containing protein [Prauserella muralis]|uniref:Uncharacterized protein n=1 Tax=Prauserella muralis TaxID=588067 RepID=A0A2V4ANX7_9PSEU|nr:CBS domain-containing protein [Prauserella muralis]PXY22312.1 hypothetical protein BAY60_20785 [Prauserella muralis]TWE27961.1 BON domain-containing protein [Prauserella muralis]